MSDYTCIMSNYDCSLDCNQDFRKVINLAGSFPVPTGVQPRGRGREVIHNCNDWANDIMRRIMEFSVSGLDQTRGLDETYNSSIPAIIQSYGAPMTFNEGPDAIMDKYFSSDQSTIVSFALLSVFALYINEYINCANVKLPSAFQQFFLQYPIEANKTDISRKAAVYLTLTALLENTPKLIQAISGLRRPTVGQIDLECLYIFSGLTSWPAQSIISFHTTPINIITRSFTFNYEYARDRYARRYDATGDPPAWDYISTSVDELSKIYSKYTPSAIMLTTSSTALNTALPLKVILVLKLGSDEKLNYISMTTTREWEILIGPGTLYYSSHKYVIYEEFNILEICIGFVQNDDMLSLEILDPGIKSFVQCAYKNLGLSSNREIEEELPGYKNKQRIMEWLTKFESPIPSKGRVSKTRGGGAMATKKGGGAMEEGGYGGKKRRRKSNKGRKTRKINRRKNKTKRQRRSSINKRKSKKRH